MYPRTINIEVQSAAEAAAVEQALAMVRELEEIANAAPDGQVLAQVEPAALDRGRRFQRDRLQLAHRRQHRRAVSARDDGGRPRDAQIY